MQIIHDFLWPPCVVVILGWIFPLIMSTIILLLTQSAFVQNVFSRAPMHAAISQNIFGSKICLQKLSKYFGLRVVAGAEKPLNKPLEKIWTEKKWCGWSTHISPLHKFNRKSGQVHSGESTKITTKFYFPQNCVKTTSSLGQTLDKIRAAEWWNTLWIKMLWNGGP